MIGWSKMDKRLPEMTPNSMLLDVKCITKENSVKKTYNVK